MALMVNILVSLCVNDIIFINPCRLLMAAGAEKDWPKGRGIFLNHDKTFLTWINEEDHIRIISMQNGGNLAQVYQRLAKVSNHSASCDRTIMDFGELMAK